MTDKPPKQWAELTEKQRIALIRRADADIFWEEFFERLARYKYLATVLVGAIALWGVFNEWLAAWLQDTLNNGSR